jgi:hypothetical protein
VRIDEAKLRETIKRLLIEVGAKDPDKIGDEQTDREKIFETVMLASDMSKIEGTQTLGNLTADLSNVPKFIKELNKINLVATEDREPNIAADVNVANVLRTIADNARSMSKKEKGPLGIDKLVAFRVPGESGARGAYDFKKNSYLRAAIVDPHGNDINKIFKVANAFYVDILKGKAGGDMVEFSMTAALCAIAPEVDFYNLRGNESGRDIIARDSRTGVYKLESKWTEGSDQKVAGKTQKGPNYNFNMGKTPPDFQENKFYIFTQPFGKTVPARADIMWLYWSVSPGNLESDLPPNELNIENIDTAMMNNYRELSSLISNYQQFQNLLVQAAKETTTKIEGQHIDKFLNLVAGGANAGAVEKLEKILRNTVFQREGMTLDYLEVEINRARNSGDDSKVAELENLKRSIQQEINDISLAVIKLNRPNPSYEEKYAVKKLLTGKMKALQQLHVIKYHDIKPEEQADTQKIGDAMQVAQSPNYKAASGKNYSETLKLKSPEAAVWFIYSFLRNPLIDFEPKEKLVDLLKGLRYNISKAGESTTLKGSGTFQPGVPPGRGATLTNANYVYLQIIGSESAKELAATETLRNIHTYESFLKFDLSDMVDEILQRFKQSDIPNISTFPDSSDRLVGGLLIELSNLFGLGNIIVPQLEEVSGVIQLLRDDEEVAKIVDPYIQSRPSLDDQLGIMFPKKSIPDESQSTQRPDPTMFGSKMKFENVQIDLGDNEVQNQFDNAYKDLADISNDANQMYSQEYSEQDYKEFEAEIIDAQSENIEESKLYESILRKLLAASKKRR